MAAFFRNSISADSNSLGRPVNSKILTVTIDGKKTSFTLSKYKSTDGFDFVLSKKSFIGKEESIKLSGFEEDLSLCQESFIRLSDNATGICLAGDAGVHSQNIQLIKYSNDKFSNVEIKNNNESDVNFYSDVPNFYFEDRNKDGLLDLVVDARNYDADPITEAIRSYYLNSSSGFVFDGKENIAYNK